jgi:hypothetical protein
MYRLAMVACLVLFLGCQQRIKDETTFERDDGEYVMTIVLDMSSSFSELMAEDGKGWAFVCQIIDKYFRERIGHHDKLILAQLSASDRALVWKGTPLELRNEFHSAAEFRAWIEKKADPTGSRLYGGIIQAVEYTLADPVIASGKGKSAVFVLSDMIDNRGSDSTARDRAVSALAKIGKAGGSVGLYYVDVERCALWEQLLRDAGVPADNMVVEADIVGHPMLPNFE